MAHVVVTNGPYKKSRPEFSGRLLPPYSFFLNTEPDVDFSLPISPSVDVLREGAVVERDECSEPGE